MPRHSSTLVSAERIGIEVPEAVYSRLDALFDDIASVSAYDKISLQQLVNRERRILVAFRGYSISDMSPWLLRPVSSDPLIGNIIDSKSPYIVENTASHEHWKPEPGTADVRSWMGVPVILDGEIIALITLDHSTVGFYKDASIDTLVGLIQKAAYSIDRLFEELNSRRFVRNTENIGILLRTIGQQIASPQLLNAVVQEITLRLKCSHCTIFMAEREGPTTVLSPKATTNISSKPRYFQTNEGLVGDVFSKGVPRLSNDAQSEPEFSRSPIQTAQARAMILAPIRVDKNPTGVICAEKDSYGWFYQEDLLLLEAVGQQAGIAIQRSRDLIVFNKISERILALQATPGTGRNPAKRERDILKTIVDGAISLTNATTGVIYKVSRDGLAVLDRYCPPDFNHPNPRMDDPGALTRTAIKGAQPIPIRDTANDSRVSPELLPLYRSMIVVPLAIKDVRGSPRVIGVLFVDYKEFHEFSIFEQQLLTTLCDQAAIAITNAELLRKNADLALRSKRHVESRIALEHQLAKLHTASSADNPSEVFHRIGNGILELLGDDVTITIDPYDEKTDMFKRPPYEFGPLAGKLNISPRSEGGTGRYVIKHRSALFYKETRTLKPGRPEVREELRTLNIVSYAALPIIRTVHVYGVLYVNSQKPLKFEKETQQILQLYASHAAVAIEIAQLLDELTAANAVKERFFQDVTHELKKPLTMVRNDLAALTNGLYGPLSETQRARLQSADLNAADEEAILDNFIDFNRLQSQAAPYSPSSQMLADVIEKALVQVSSAIQQADAQVTTDIDRSLEFVFDGYMIRRVLMNILVNAIQYSKPPRYVWITARREGAVACVSIQNRGDDIPDSRLPTIFDRIGHRSRAAKRSDGGMGIGLSIAREFVRRHGGQISVANESGRGPKFSFTLPIS